MQTADESPCCTATVGKHSTPSPSQKTRVGSAAQCTCTEAGCANACARRPVLAIHPLPHPASSGNVSRLPCTGGPAPPAPSRQPSTEKNDQAFATARRADRTPAAESEEPPQPSRQNSCSRVDGIPAAELQPSCPRDHAPAECGVRHQARSETPPARGRCLNVFKAVPPTKRNLEHVRNLRTKSVAFVYPAVNSGLRGDAKPLLN